MSLYSSHSPIESIIENARYKKDLVLGIFDQSLQHLDVVREWVKYGPEIRYKTCDPAESKGVCWARGTIQDELFDGEDISVITLSLNIESTISAPFVQDFSVNLLEDSSKVLYPILQKP